MGSRLRENPAHVFECFFEVVISNQNEERSWILQKYPESFDDQEVLKSVPEFSCPCDFTNKNIQHFSFVLTSLDGKWSFGYCRQVPGAPTVLVMISHLPWHETFYKILNQVSTLTNDKESSLLPKFLESLFLSPVPDPGFNLHVSYGDKEFTVYCPDHLKLPSIPQNRNLTEYYNAVDASNMMIIFASMLHERRILVHSRKLGSLSACVQAANSLIYPMYWQHIFIPVLPKHLIDYLSAPMPFLIGVPSTTMMKFVNNRIELNEVVILDADHNRVTTPFNDLETLPPDIVSSLKRNLKNPNLMLGDGVSRTFMRTLVKLIGGYRDSLKFNLGQKISFDSDAFILSRPPSVRPFLETMLHLQIFQQFIENRLDMLNSGIGFSDEFEYEVNLYEVHSSNNLKTQYKEWVSTMKKEGGAFLKNVKSKTNPAVKYAYKSVKDQGKRAYKGIRSKIQDIQKPTQTDSRFSYPYGKPKSAPSSPTTERANIFSNKRISYNQSNMAKSNIVDSMHLSNARMVKGIRRYKTLQIDDISLPPDELSDDPGLQKIDLDLMEDLKDVIFRRCSVSSDNLNSLGAVDEIIEGISEEPLGFSDSFCPSKDMNTFSPIPPPRLKRSVKPSADQLPNKPASESCPTTEEPLIQLGPLDEVTLFDPLKEHSTKDADLLAFLAPKATTNAKVIELKNTIQNITQNPQVFYPNTGFCPRVPQSGLVISRYPVHTSTSSTSGTCTESTQKPPLPPKTKPSSTFFLSSSELSSTEKELLSDYGLSGSPLFQSGSTGCDNVVGKNNVSDPFGMIAGQKPNPRHKNKDSLNQKPWQKFS